MATSSPIRKTDKIFVSGHRGMVGGGVVRALGRAGYSNLLTRTHKELDLCDQAAVFKFFDETRPAAMVNAAAVVGGIVANRDYPAFFIGQNLASHTNLIEAAHRTGVKKSLLVSSSCIYPRAPALPIKEDALLSAPLEPTNEWYAIAKIASLKMAEAYRQQYGEDHISLMACNLYGPGDNFDAETSHVLPALLQRMDAAAREKAAEFVIWGSGKPSREFMHVDDFAEAVVFLVETECPHAYINIGAGEDITIGELAKLIAKIVGYEGKFVYDESRPDGVPRRVLDSSRIHQLGWKARIGLKEGIAQTYAWLSEHRGELRNVQAQHWGERELSRARA